MTNRKSYALSIGTKIDDLELLKVQIFTEFCPSSHFWEATTAKQMKIDPYYKQQKCSPMILHCESKKRETLYSCSYLC